RRDPHNPFVAGTHQFKRFREAGDKSVSPSGERFARYVAAVDQLPVEQLYLIVERDGALRRWMRTAGGTRFHDEILKTAGGGDHSLGNAVLGEEVRTGGRIRWDMR